jgi:uncharacterized membrane protein
VITIMVLELKTPHGSDWAALRPVVPVFLMYLLSFVFLGIYWNNHHHMLHAADRIDGRILWANLYLLFWLSLVPFGTRWMGESHLASIPTAAYGAVLLLAAVAYKILQDAIIARQGANSRLAAAVGRGGKEWVSTGLYAVAIPAAFLRPWIAMAFYVLVALLWLVPDRRIESRLEH